MVTNWDIVSGYLDFSGSQSHYTIGDYTSNDWHKGYQGYLDAISISDENKVPVFIYIYTDWCQYCKKFQNQLLTDSYVKESLSKFVKVKINPEGSDEEKSLYKKWNGRGYPAILFQSGSGRPVHVRAPYVRDVKGWKMMTSNDFISMLNKNG